MKGLYLFHCQTEMERHKIKDRERDSLKKTLKRDRKIFLKKQNGGQDKTGRTNRQTDIWKPALYSRGKTDIKNKKPTYQLNYWLDLNKGRHVYTFSNFVYLMKI